MLVHDSRQSIADRISVALRSKPFHLLVYTAVIFLGGVLAHRAGIIHAAIEPVRELRHLSEHISNLTVQPDRISIDISYKNYLKILEKRQAALTRDLLISTPEDLVPASIRFQDRTIPVKLRLKGDKSDHWRTDKWSFRVEVRGDETLFGMKHFSIQSPETRKFLHEWLYHRALKREGLLGLRYRFVDVTVNGDHKGIYALEEHFEKRLVEHNGLREGPIVRFNEDLYWVDARGPQIARDWSSKATGGSGSYLASDIDGFQTSTWLESEAGRPQYLKAAYLLDAFRRKRLPATDVFDVRKFGRFLALCDLLGGGARNALAKHALLLRPRQLAPGAHRV